MNCPERQAWLASKKDVGAAAGEGEKNPKTLCIVAATGSLLRVFVDVYQDVLKLSVRGHVDEVLSTQDQCVC